MSAVLLGWAYKQNTGSAMTKAVLIKLVDNANDLGYAHPPMDHLTAYMEMSERSVREHIKKLEELGLVTVIREKIAAKVNLPNRYQLNIDATSSLGLITINRGTVAPAATPPRQDLLDGVAPAAEGVLQEPQTDTPSSSIPQENPQGIPSSGAGAVVVREPSQLELAVEGFNRGAEICPKWTRCTKLTDNRAKVIAVRLREVGLAGWLKAVQQAVDSAHLGGPVPTTGTHQGWRMDIGWFAKAENFTKCFEGSYAPGRQARPLGLDSIAMGINAFLDQQQGDGGDAHA